MAECGCCRIEPTLAANQRRRILWFVLALNAVMFIVELIAGLWAGSTALQGDSIDMLADALVYGLSILALTRGARAQALASLSNGLLESVLAFALLGEVAYHMTVHVVPLGLPMMVVAGAALLVNVTCGALLLGFRNEGINMRAVWLCTRNDVLGNLGTLIVAPLVFFFHTKWPDLVIGVLLALIMLRTSVGVVAESLSAYRKNQAFPDPERL